MNCAHTGRRVALTGGLALFLAVAALGAEGPLDGEDALGVLLDRTSRATSAYVDVISQMNCTEHVTQLMLNEAGKTVDKQESNFDYLVLLNHVGSDLTLVESRLAVPERGAKKAQPPLLLSNGFSLLFLVFHPYYAPGFEFTLGEPVTVAGRQFATLQFRHIRGTRSPAALAVRGREYQLDLAGTALVDPSTGTIVKITAGLDVAMDDVGLRRFTSTIDYVPQAVKNQTYWLPAQVSVDVESRHQHWRNIHQFSKYKRFGVNTNEEIKTP